MTIHIPRTDLLPASNLNARLFSICRRFPSRTALVDPAGSWTFAQLAGLSLAAASLISSLTSRPRIGLMLPPVKEFAPAFYGSLLAGKCVLPVNFLLAPGEIAKVAADSDLDCIITSRMMAERLAGLDLRAVFIEDFKDPLLAAAANPAPVPPEALRIDPDLPAVVIYTAGTSADPKGVVLSHANLLANTDGCVHALKLDESFTLLASLPFFHVFGLTTGLVMPLAFGATTVMLPRFSVPALVSLVRDHSVSIILTVPSMWTVLARHNALDPADLGSLRICISGGEPLPATTAESFLQLMGFPLLEGYGMTETSPVISINRPDRARPGSVGHPLPGLEIRIIDDRGNPLPPGTEGEILVRGPNVMLGYHNRPDLTSQVLSADGWLRTGDLGRFDADGFLYITGRAKDLIITGGENVSPREVEEIILTCPGVAEAAVVGLHNGSRGEVVAAYVVRSEGASLSSSELKDFCRRHLAGYKVPRSITFLPALPRNYAGKLLKRKLLS